MAYQGTSPNIGTYKKLDAITFDGTSTTYAVTSGGAQISLASAESCIISLNGVIQDPGISYTVSGANITFAVAPSVGSTFFGVLMGERVLVAVSNAVQLTGGTMSGALTLNGDPVVARGAATKQYVDSSVAGSSGIGYAAQAAANAAQSTANSKQDLLVSGTNIKTINGTTVLGSGDVVVWSASNDGAGSGLDADLLDGQHASAFQSTLVSGTNIKTINGTTVLGSGNIETYQGQAFSAF